METFIAILVLLVLIVGFIFSWKLNHATPIPEGSFNTPPKCDGCTNSGCGNYTKMDNEESDEII